MLKFSQKLQKNEKYVKIDPNYKNKHETSLIMGKNLKKKQIKSTENL